MPHDIIDNRNVKLLDQLNAMLSVSDAAKMAVGYFFLSGFDAVRERLCQLKEIRILIGNTADRETIEQLTEAYKRVELVQAIEEKERFQARAARQKRAESTRVNLRETVERMDQTDAAQALVGDLLGLVQAGRLQVKVYTRGRLHAKAYICDYPVDGRFERGIAVVGSSNLSLAGLTHNTELNVVVSGNENHAQLSRWFEELWADAQPFEAVLLEELQQSWAAALPRPYDIYMKTLYALVGDRLDDEAKAEILWDDDITRALADFQKAAVRSAVQMIRDYGGAFVSDVVGLGKSFVGAGILKHFHHTQGSRPLIICPKPLEDMWRNYNDTYDLGAIVLPMSLLREQESGKGVLDEKRFKDRDLVLIDESHNFRHHTSQRYEALQDYLMRGMRKVCLLTATPRNKSALDVYNQIKLFHPDDITALPVDPPNLKEYFKAIEQGTKRLQDLLVHILVRRTRRHILRWYGYAADSGTALRELSDGQAGKYLAGEARAYVMVAGRHQYFPRRELETLRYSIEDTYAGLYDKLRGYLGRPGNRGGAVRPGTELTYARYGLWNYVRPAKQNVEPYRSLHRAGLNLRGLIRVMLFKRFESSVAAFRETLERLHRIHELFLEMLDRGIVPAGEESQRLLYEADAYEDGDLADQLEEVAGRYKLEDFDADSLRAHISADHKLIHKMLDLVAPITPDRDAKLQCLRSKLKRGIPQQTGKVLIFTQFADTARYIFENVNPGGRAKDIESIYGSDKSKARMAARFAPLANPHISLPEGEPDVRILVATDVMSEGLNLQDGDVVVNYDLHWNPVRLIQRFGRIDRIGSENERIWGFNFLPETKLDQHLGLTAILRARIAEIQQTIGEDSAILDRDEQVNEDAMFAIYEKKSGQLSLYEDADGDFVDLNEAEELLRTLRKEDPLEFERIANLRDGIRTGRAVFGDRGTFVFCQAGKFQQLLLADPEGKIVSRDIAEVVNRIKCGRSEPAAALPPQHNGRVMELRAVFAEEVTHRLAQQRYALALTVQQRYVLRELRALYSMTDDEEIRAKVNTLEGAFKNPVSKAINRELNVIRRNGLTGQNLVRALSEVYLEHAMAEQEFLSRIRTETETETLPRIICSEALI